MYFVRCEGILDDGVSRDLGGILRIEVGQRFKIRKPVGIILVFRLFQQVSDDVRVAVALKRELLVGSQGGVQFFSSCSFWRRADCADLMEVTAGWTPARISSAFSRPYIL